MNCWFSVELSQLLKKILIVNSHCIEFWSGIFYITCILQLFVIIIGTGWLLATACCGSLTGSGMVCAARGVTRPRPAIHTLRAPVPALEEQITFAAIAVFNTSSREDGRTWPFLSFSALDILPRRWYASTYSKIRLR